MGIEKGSILKFKIGEEVYQSITAEVVDPKSIRPIKYKNKQIALSVAAKDILKEKFDKKWKAVQGTIFWTHKGKTIRELMDNSDII